jgi:hypothetical protein
MIYGLALTHHHRLPAAPGVFRPTIQLLIDKLLDRGAGTGSRGGDERPTGGLTEAQL